MRRKVVMLRCWENVVVQLLRLKAYVIIWRKPYAAGVDRHQSLTKRY